MSHECDVRPACSDIHDGKVNRRGHKLETIEGAREKKVWSHLRGASTKEVFTYKNELVGLRGPCFTQDLGVVAKSWRRC